MRNNPSTPLCWQCKVQTSQHCNWLCAWCLHNDPGWSRWSLSTRCRNNDLRISRVVLCLPFHTPSRYQFNRQSLLLVYGLFSNYAEGCLLDRARFACISPQLSWRSCVKYFRKTQNVTPQPWIQPHNWKHLSTNGSAFIRGYM